MLNVGWLGDASMRELLRGISLLATGSLMTAACSDPECSCIGAQLYADACATPQREVQGELIGGFDECVLDFGAISARSQRTVLLSNPGIVPTAVDPALDQGADAPVRYSLLGDVAHSIQPGLSVLLAVEAEVLGNGPAQASLIVTTDANNLPADSIGAMVVELRALGSP